MFNYLQDEAVEGVILGVEVAEADRYGSLVYDEQGTLLQFAEKQAGAGVINGGVYLFRDRLLKQFPQKMPLSFEYDVFPELLQQSVCLKVHPVQAPFLDIGTPASLSQAEAFVQQYFQPF
jgi:NDP-sugar pyrophosphorylase family protein